MIDLPVNEKAMPLDLATLGWGGISLSLSLSLSVFGASLCALRFALGP